MDFKKVLVSFLAIASLLLLTATVSALPMASSVNVEVDGVAVDDAVVMAGDSITLRVEFIAGYDATTDGIDNDGDLTVDEVDESAFNVVGDASDVRVRAELEGNEGDATEVTSFFDVLDGKTYVKTLKLQVPQVDADELSEDMTLNLRIWNSDLEEFEDEYTLLVQRESYTANFMSVNVNSNVKAGESFPVEVVIRNTGYNDLEDMYVTAKIASLGVEKKVFVGDLLNVVNAEDSDDEDESDVMSGKLVLSVPYTAKAGKYLVEVTATNGEMTSTDSVEITVQNDFPEAVMKTSTGLLFVNPTNDLKVYRVVLSEGEKIVSVQAGDSESVDVKASTEDYVVSVMTLNGEVVGNFTFKALEQTSLTTGNSIVVLTVILGIVFFVLLVVLIVLLSKKPQKSEDSESYY